MQKTILIVEDSALNRELLCDILSEHYKVLDAPNGQVALEILHERKDSISLILLDMMMPVMDGYTFLDRLKEDQELSLIPVIAITQDSREVDEVAALTHGATDFVPKPYRPQVILRRAASLIKLRETAAMVNQLQNDRLTGLFSREFFVEKVRERLLEDPNTDYCLLCSNIENFKLINDAFGSQEGNRLLQQIAALTRRMAGSGSLCARFTADRFIYLVKSENVRPMLESIERDDFMQISSLMKNVVIRWGVYHILDRTVPVPKMCDRALLAVNSIKGQYNRHTAVYDDSLRSQLLREMAITDAMESALAEEQFSVYLQPKYSLRTGRICGAEALVRWTHPTFGFLSPGEFIPLFEKNGFISRLDRYVWERACMLLRRWKDQGLPLHPVSVNISRADMFQDHLADVLMRLMRKYDLEPGLLHLEITESAYAEYLDQILSAVDELRGLGFVVEMDDFCSGYSSLNMLSQMNVDVLKLDMAFIRSETAKPKERSILDDVIRMAHRLSLQVVAEGVETQEQANLLRGMGCDYAQGYYFAAPMPASQFEKMLETTLSQSRLPFKRLWGGGGTKTSLRRL